MFRSLKKMFQMQVRSKWKSGSLAKLSARNPTPGLQCSHNTRVFHFVSVTWETTPDVRIVSISQACIRLYCILMYLYHLVPYHYVLWRISYIKNSCICLLNLRQAHFQPKKTSSSISNFHAWTWCVSVPELSNLETKEWHFDAFCKFAQLLPPNATAACFGRAGMSWSLIHLQWIKKLAHDILWHLWLCNTKLILICRLSSNQAGII